MHRKTNHPAPSGASSAKKLRGPQVAAIGMQRPLSSRCVPSLMSQLAPKGGTGLGGGSPTPPPPSPAALIPAIRSRRCC